jgi:hypothetical protein
MFGWFINGNWIVGPTIRSDNTGATGRTSVETHTELGCDSANSGERENSARPVFLATAR